MVPRYDTTSLDTLLSSVVRACRCTVRYAPPEALESVDAVVSEAADSYAFGSLLFEVRA